MHSQLIDQSEQYTVYYWPAINKAVFYVPYENIIPKNKSKNILCKI